MFQPALYNCTRFERGFWGLAISRHCWWSNKTLLWCNTIDSSVKEATNTGSQTHPYSIAISIKQIADNNKLVTSIQAWRTMKSVSTSWDYVYVSILEQRVKDNQWKHMVLLECYHHWMNFVLFCHLRLGLMEQDWALHFCISTYCSRICITCPMTRVVIDATEIFIEQPSCPVALQQRFISYKNHNTLKALMGLHLQEQLAICWNCTVVAYLIVSLQSSVVFQVF